MKEYKITFDHTLSECNWNSISSIDKETLDGFIDYLYSLDRHIQILPYIPGGGPFLNPYLDKTYKVHQIVDDIKHKVPKDEMIKKRFDHFLEDYSNSEDDYHRFFSRWVFIYMFRGEFKRYMNERGYEVVVDGGWVLNNERRERIFGLIK